MRSVLVSGSGEQVVGRPALALAGVSLVAASVPALVGITILGVLLVVGLLLLALLITTGCGPPN